MPAENNPKKVEGNNRTEDVLKHFKNEIIMNEENFNKQIRALEVWWEKNKTLKKYSEKYPNITKVLELNREIIHVSDQMLKIWKKAGKDMSVYERDETKELLKQYFNLLSQSVTHYEAAAFKEVSIFNNDTSIRKNLGSGMTVDSVLSAPMQRVVRIVMPLESMKNKMEKLENKNDNDLKILNHFIEFIKNTSRMIDPEKDNKDNKDNKKNYRPSEKQPESDAGKNFSIGLKQNIQPLFYRHTEIKYAELDEEKLVNDLQFYSDIRKLYKEKGGKHDKKGSIRDEQIKLLQECINKIKQNENMAYDEKVTVLLGILENFTAQLDKNKRSSKLFKVVNDLKNKLTSEHNVIITHEIGDGAFLHVDHQQRAMVYLIENKIALSDQMSKSFEKASKKITIENIENIEKNFKVRRK